MRTATQDLQWAVWRGQAERRRAIASQLGMRLPALTLLIDRVLPVPGVRLKDGSCPEGPAAAWLERQGYLQRIGAQRRGSQRVPIRIITESGLDVVRRAMELGW